MKEKMNAWLDKPWTNRSYIKLCTWSMLIALPCYAIGMSCYLFPEKVTAFTQKLNRVFKSNKEIETEIESE